MAQRILRPLEYGDLLDEMFDLYKSNFLLLVGITGLVFLPVCLIVYSVAGVAAPILISILGLPMHYVTVAAATWAISQRYLGKDATIIGSYKSIMNRAIGFIATMLLVTIFISLGFLLIVPGIIFAFWYAFISQVFIVEGKSGVQARNRSKELAAGHWGRIFVLAVLTTVITSIGSMIFTTPAQFLSVAISGGDEAAASSGILVGLSHGLASALTTPIQVIAFVLLYYDVRVRKEGFDLELLAANLNEKPAVQPVEQEETLVQ